MEIVSRIDAALRAANIPIAGVSDNGNGTYAIQFLSAATDVQKTNAAKILQSTPKKTLVPVPATTLTTQINALNKTDQNTLIVAIVVDFLQRNPDVGLALGLTIVGDQDGA